jgi:hypothetical protein
MTVRTYHVKKKNISFTILLKCICLYIFQNPKIYYLHVKSDIKFRFATTLITSKVANSEKNPVEAHFEVTLPDAAFITNFVM